MRDNYNDVILRWTMGTQNTVTLSDFSEKSKYVDSIWLCKLSIMSFQRWFLGARFVLMYNGFQYEDFVRIFEEIDVQMFAPVEFHNQHEELKKGEITNSYSYFPTGVWWKWVPFRLDRNKHEIAVDTDIICINEPKSWYDWINGDEEILVAPDRFEKVCINTCGDFYTHPLLKGKKPANCGIVGQRSGCDFAERFFEITDEVRLGYTHDSMFITEQGTVNLWIYSLKEEGINHLILDARKNAWARDFLLFIQQGTVVETIHAVSWYKKVIRNLGKIFENQIIGRYNNTSEFISDVLKNSSELDQGGKYLIDRQARQHLQGKEYFFAD